MTKFWRDILYPAQNIFLLLSPCLLTNIVTCSFLLIFHVNICNTQKCRGFGNLHNKVQLCNWGPSTNFSLRMQTVYSVHLLHIPCFFALCRLATAICKRKAASSPAEFLFKSEIPRPFKPPIKHRARLASLFPLGLFCSTPRGDMIKRRRGGGEKLLRYGETFTLKSAIPRRGSVQRKFECRWPLSTAPRYEMAQWLHAYCRHLTAICRNYTCSNA